ncbi:glycosyltransferase [Thauera sp. 27]|nr:glycosyltransferase [Thauera sp. 27]
MRIAYITTQFPAPSETFACNDVRMLVELGADVRVYGMRSPHSRAQEMARERGVSNVTISACGPREVVGGLLYAFYRIDLLLKLVLWVVALEWRRIGNLIRCLAFVPASFFVLKELRRERPDVVHLFWGHYPSLVGQLVLSDLRSVKVTMFLGAYDLAMRLAISGDLARRVSGVFTHARANLHELAEVGVAASSVSVVHRGVDQSSLGKYVCDSVSKDLFEILSAGRLIESKRFDAAISLLPELPGFRLVIAGEGPDEKRLKDLAVSLGVADRVEFCGFLSQERLLKRMASAGFFVLLSDKAGERLPNVVKEAMFAGCVCVVADTPGIEELVAHGVTGFVVGNANSNMASEIIRNLGHQDIGLIRERASLAIKDNFDLKVSMTCYLDRWVALCSADAH